MQRVVSGRHARPGEVVRRPAFGLRCRCRREREDQPATHGRIPLTGVSAEATLTDVACEVRLTQRYRNDEDQPLEVAYTFPVDSRAAVCGFEAEIDGRKLIGKVMSSTEARETYDDAIASGGGAYLLEQKKQEIFSINVGNLPPGKECVVHIKYVTELSLEDDKIRFTLPTTIAPRYEGQDTTDEEREALKEVKYIPSSGTSTASTPFGLELDIAIEMPSPLISVESPSHPIRFQLNPDAPTKGNVLLATQQTALDRDFVLLIQQKNAHQPGLWLDSERQAVMLTLYPKFNQVENKREFIFLVDRSGSMSGQPIQHAKQALQLFLRSLPEGCRFNIVGFGSNYKTLFRESRDYNDKTLEEATHHVDRMAADLGGTEILTPLSDLLKDHCDPEYAKQIFVLTDGEVSNTGAVIQAIRDRYESKTHDSILKAVNERICTYDGQKDYKGQYWYHCRTCSRDPLWGCCVVCKEVCHKGHDLVSHYGGFYCDCGSKLRSRCQALKPDEQREPIPMPPPIRFRVFTLGIGSSVSRELVLGMAQAGRGTAEFVIPGERMESKVMRQLRLAMQPSVDDLACDWGETWGPLLTQTPQVLPPLFDGTRMSIFGLVEEGKTLPQDSGSPVKVSYTLPGEGGQNTDKHEHGFLPSEASLASTPAVRTLAARSLIGELSEKEKSSPYDEGIKGKIDALAIRFQLATSRTSFVAVEERDEATEGTMQRRVVPNFSPAVNLMTPREAYRVASYQFHGAKRCGRGRGRGGRGGGGGVRGGQGGGGGGGGMLHMGQALPVSRGLGYGGGYAFDVFDTAENSRRSRSRSRSPTRDRDRERDRGSDSRDKREESFASVRKRKRGRPRGEEMELESSMHAPEAEEEEYEDEEANNEEQAETKSRRVEARHEDSHETLAKVVVLQRANGSFKLDDKLAQLLRKPIQHLRAALARLGVASDAQAEDMWATALALALLEIRLHEIADDWQMMADKSRRWLRAQPSQGPGSLSAWVDEAKKALA